MSINTVVLDLDGTLLSSKGEISNYNKKVIYKLKKKNIDVMIATGRIYKATQRYKEELGLKTPVICYNGSMVIDGKTDKKLLEITVDNDIVKRIIEIARKNDIHLNLFQDENWYVEAKRKEVQTYKDVSGLKYHILNFEKLEIRDITKLMYIANHDKLLKINKILDKEFKNRIYKAFSKPYFLEVLNPKSSKGKTLKQILKKRGKKLENTMAFGDSFNDLEMLEAVGKGVIMENAPDELKKKFKYKAKKNDDNGVGLYLNDYFNLKL